MSYRQFYSKHDEKRRMDKGKTRRSAEKRKGGDRGEIEEEESRGRPSRYENEEDE